LLEAYFGDAIAIDPQLELECLRIPHFYSAFYVYKYATGLSAAIALAQRVLAKEPGAVDAYLDLLRSGGSKFPLETLKAAGVDMSRPEPVQATIALFEKRLGDLEQLL
jgi:oligoendopeptidase F